MNGLGVTFYQAPFVRIVSVIPGSVAERAGLMAGDSVERMGDTEVKGPSEWVSVIRAHPEQLLRLMVRRQGALTEISVIPARIKDGEGKEIGQIGAQVSHSPLPERAIRQINYGPLEAAFRAGQETYRQVRLLLLSLYKLIVGDLSPKNLSGPLGIAKVAGASAEMGLVVFCQTLAILSISLGVMNLFPVPMLDGGHLMLYLVEAIKGSPVPEGVQVVCNQIGMALLMGLMLFAVYNDILKI